MEFMNLINELSFKKKPTYNNNAQNCSITIIELGWRGGDILNDLDIKIVIQNDAKHI